MRNCQVFSVVFETMPVRMPCCVPSAGCIMRAAVAQGHDVVMHAWTHPERPGTTIGSALPQPEANTLSNTMSTCTHAKAVFTGMPTLNAQAACSDATTWAAQALFGRPSATRNRTWQHYSLLRSRGRQNRFLGAPKATIQSFQKPIKTDKKAPDKNR